MQMLMVLKWNAAFEGWVNHMRILHHQLDDDLWCDYEAMIMLPNNKPRESNCRWFTASFLQSSQILSKSLIWGIWFAFLCARIDPSISKLWLWGEVFGSLVWQKMRHVKKELPQSTLMTETPRKIGCIYISQHSTLLSMVTKKSCTMLCVSLLTAFMHVGFAERFKTTHKVTHDKQSGSNHKLKYLFFKEAKVEETCLLQ